MQASWLTGRDITGLLLTGDMYAAPYDLLSMALGAQPDRVRAITGRWRRADLAQTGRIGPGPGWCWLTPAGMRAAGLRYPARRPPLAGIGHVPDAEVHWPDVDASPYPGECWAVEAELSPKGAARTSAIMTGLLTRTAGWEPPARPGRAPRYDHVVYLCAPAALPVVRRAARQPARPAGQPDRCP